ncbi:MAG: menaquinone biosynthesis protein [Planctomycetes bacterium]|nr:menaquinone biosynthesis protein [Planctomycetota bacterium]
MKPRIGAVPYGVGAPLITGLDHDPSVCLVEDVPSRLIGWLRSGELDAALVSSVEAFRRPGYTALADIGICCRGAVRSVRAFRRPEVPIRSVGLDDSSETSAALLRVLLPRIAPEATPEFERVEPTTEPDALPHDLVMLIGDPGLRATPGTREVIDLGAAWHEWTDLPFVFALWLIAPGAPAERIAQILRRAHADGARNHTDDGTGGAVHYDIGAPEIDGLRRFHAEASRLGLADRAIEPRFVGRSTTSKARQRN